MAYKLARQAVFSTSVEVFLLLFALLKLIKVFSTSVEVFPTRSKLKKCNEGLLHVRGGVSMGEQYINDKNQSSPRPWRCFSSCAERTFSPLVFSTSVEVFLSLFAP